MAQPLSNLLVHLIFSTKERHPFLTSPELLQRTHAYLGGILREVGSPSIVAFDERTSGISAKRPAEQSFALSALGVVFYRIPGPAAQAVISGRLQRLVRWLY